MKKRIRVNQATIGMFVEDLEQQTSGTLPLPPRFAIQSTADLEKLRNSSVMSLLIDTSKGSDVAELPLPKGLSYSARERVLGPFSSKEIERAEETVAEATPLIKGILSEARMNGVVSLDTAALVVDQVMSLAMDNSRALLAVSRLKSKDQASYLHSLAVGALMVCFGRCLGFDEDAVHILGLSGLLHDIGKTTIPAEILGKPGALTPEELEIMRTHPRRGFEMLKSIGHAPQVVLDVCLYHHEHYDGKGYPERLAGEAIPSVARVAAICDVYDAMTTLRPYKRAWTPKETVDMMQKSKGHFDPKLLQIFLTKVVEGARL